MSAMVSVVIPTFNRASFLPDAVRSVLEQTHRDLELIVVDDGSTDDTPAVLARFPAECLQVIRIPYSGSAAHARNVGVARAKGRFVAFLDSDDVWLPTKLERQLAALREAPKCRWSYTLFDHIDERGAAMAPLKGGVGKAISGMVLASMITEEALVMVQSVVAEATLVREVGGFDETPELREDLDLCFRMAARSETCAVNEHLLRVRHHAGRTTFDLPEVREWRVRALRKLADGPAEPRIRRLCRKEIARELVDLARAYDWKGRPKDALAALGRAARERPHHWEMWTTLTKVAIRPFVTRGMIDAYHRRAANRPSPGPRPSEDRNAAGR
jgi:glycosyltransferase involved in cell wall biosynthesis